MPEKALTDLLFPRQMGMRHISVNSMRVKLKEPWRKDKVRW